MWIHRLDHMVLESCRQRPIAIAGSRVRGQRNRRQIGITRPQVIQELVPVFAWQTEIGDEHIRRYLRYPFNRFHRR